jgi:hypothetical protein
MFLTTLTSHSSIFTFHNDLSSYPEFSTEKNINFVPKKH